MKEACILCTAATPKLQLAQPSANLDAHLSIIEEGMANEESVIVFPELSMTGYSCADLFGQSKLIDEAESAILTLNKTIQKLSKQKEVSNTRGILCMSNTYNAYPLYIVGAPIIINNNLYNCAVICQAGNILGIVPKTYLPNYNEFYEKRWFSSGLDFKEPINITYAGQQDIPVSPNLIFESSTVKNFKLAVEICEDAWVNLPPSLFHVNAGATIIANLSASNEIIGKAAYRRQLIGQLSARGMCGYIYASSSVGESTNDIVFSGHNMIYENGYKLAESELFQPESKITTGIDLERLMHDRLKANHVPFQGAKYTTIYFENTPYVSVTKAYQTRKVNAHPFVPKEGEGLKERCAEIIEIQAQGLARRFTHTHAKKMILGISGGLDSTLALLVCMKALKILNLPPTYVLGVTMPGFGTTKRTKNNAIDLMTELGIEQKTISISESAKLHLSDLGHDGVTTDITYENAQARERTQVLMDLCNMHNGIVIGTGDLSELALGWCTYNGDHMSMYGVNTSIPKTLVRSLVKYFAEWEFTGKVRECLLDIVDTPVSPELLPPKENGEIAQVTEDNVGPYELHDFFMYYMLRFGFAPVKIYELAKLVFADKYDTDTILYWMKMFYRRFFVQQFKRSCLPDGPKVGSICLSPRGDWRMPSDVQGNLWLKDIEDLLLQVKSKKED